jgi:hypothetical protein
MSTTENLKVVSNTARDILQSAGTFQTVPKVIWEYVSNSLQYVDQNVTPKVVVKINAAKKTASIADNASGMDRAGLQNFFTMHGLNQDRLSGKAGRGMFGTGKSAAFGVAEQLRVRSVHRGLLNTVVLSRSDIEHEEVKGNVTEVPIKNVDVDVPTAEANGTVITIDGISAKCDVAAVIAYVERHIGRGFKGAEVIVNGQEVEFQEPAFTEEHSFQPTEELRAVLGDKKLVIKVSPSPLDQDQRGIDITSNGVLFETTLGSVANKDMVQYIFGQLEVPTLINEGKGSNPAFNMTRDMKLNPENALVQAIHTFVSVHVEEIRRQIVDEERKRRQTVEAQRLRRQADAIAKILNADFTEYSDKVQRIRATVTSVGRDHVPDEAVQAGEDFKMGIFGGDDAVEMIAPEGGVVVPVLRPEPPPTPEPAPRPPQPAPDELANNPDVDVNEDGDPLGRVLDAKKSTKSSRGGFSVDFRHLGAEDNRAIYDRDIRTILINLDFPQIADELAKDGIESAPFQRLANEVAITEYAIAVSSELVTSSIYTDASDYIFEIRKTINRLSRKVALTA